LHPGASLATWTTFSGKVELAHLCRGFSAQSECMQQSFMVCIASGDHCHVRNVKPCDGCKSKFGQMHRLRMLCLARCCKFFVYLRLVCAKLSGHRRHSTWSPHQNRAKFSAQSNLFWFYECQSTCYPLELNVQFSSAGRLQLHSLHEFSELRCSREVLVLGLP